MPIISCICGRVYNSVAIATASELRTLRSLLIDLMYFSAYNRVCQCPSKAVGIPPLPRQSADLLPIPRGKFIISFIMTSTNPPSASHISYTIPGTSPTQSQAPLQLRYHQNRRTHRYYRLWSYLLLFYFLQRLSIMLTVHSILPHPSKSTRWPSVFFQVSLALPSLLFQLSV